MAISKLEEFFPQESWLHELSYWLLCMLIKLVLKKKTIFLDESSSFDLSLLFSLKFTEGHLITDHQKIYPRSKIKTDTKNHEKVILILQRVISVFKIQGNQRTTLNNVCWIFDQTSLISKNTFQN